MFTKNDYLKYFDELYEVEMLMKREANKLMRTIKDPKIQGMLQSLFDDEVRHAKIV